MEESGQAEATAADLATLAGPLPRPLASGSASPERVASAYRLPVAGRLHTGLGEISPSGVRSRGLSFAVAPGASVQAPADGIVRYARPFRSYGTVVILDHGSGWTSLVSGLAAAGAWDPVAALVLCGPFAVRDLLVEGRRVVQDGMLTGLDLGAALDRATARVARLAG